MMKEREPGNSGWEGWKSVVLLFVLLHLFNPFQGPVQEIVTGQKEGLKIAERIGGDVEKVATESQKKPDYFGGLSEEERKDIIAGIKWETNHDFERLGDARAIKGGSIRLNQVSYPATLRTVGKNANTTMNTMIQAMAYESLLNLSVYPFYFYPALANKWSVADDKVTFYFSIDPDAKWSDGKPVIAQDVVATWDLMTDKGIEDPFNNTFWAKYERPIALNNQVVMVKAKDKTWRSFITMASSFFVMPAHVIGEIEGKDYLKRFNNRLMVGSGPYALHEVDQPNRLIFRRRPDYWAVKKEQNIGQNNFDRIEFYFTTDEELAFEKFKAGDFDFVMINEARKWVMEMDFDRVKNGWIQKRKVFNLKPKGTQGFSFNLRDKPFNDINIRKAFAYLWPRDELMEKLMYNEYDFIDSFFEASPAKGENNPIVRFDPQKAVEYLHKSGWTERDNQGYLVKDGENININLSYVGKGVEKFFTLYQEELKRVGIGLSLREVTWATQIQDVGERNFNMTYGAYTGSAFPMPENLFHTRYADQKNSANRWGYKNPKVDELTERYEAEYDPEKRTALLKQIDEIVTNEYLMAFAWYAPAERIAYWNKFDYPFHVLGKTGDYRAIVSLWWHDPKKEEALKNAMKTGSTLPVGEFEVKPWQNLK
jgi:microcin C transport system substrate-binding protein